MGSCQNHGPLLGPLNNRCRLILRTQNGTIILTTTHILLHIPRRSVYVVTRDVSYIYKFWALEIPLTPGSARELLSIVRPLILTYLGRSTCDCAEPQGMLQDYQKSGAKNPPAIQHPGPRIPLPLKGKSNKQVPSQKGPKTLNGELWPKNSGFPGDRSSGSWSTSKKRSTRCACQG